MFSDALILRAVVPSPVRTQLVAFAVLMSFAGSLVAATVGDLHSAIVPVADNSTTEFERGIEAAFQVVITKLTGNSQSATLTSVAKLRARARQYNTLFGYERGADGALLLRADFDVPAVSAALRERGIAVWGRERPQVVAWLVVADANGRRAAPDVATQEIYDSFGRHATLRAIPVRRLLPDTATQTLLSAAANNDEMLVALNTLGKGYEAPARLALVLAQTPESTWQSHWQLEVEEEALNGSVAGELPVPVVTSAFDLALDALARHYLQGAASSAASVVELAIEDVASADGYGRVLDYLTRLDGVREIGVSRVEGTTVYLQLNAHGGLPALVQMIGFSQVLTAVPEAPGRYRLASP